MNLMTLSGFRQILWSWKRLRVTITALRAVIVMGFANKNRLRRWAKPISLEVFWVVIAQQVRDSTVNGNKLFSDICR